MKKKDGSGRFRSVDRRKSIAAHAMRVREGPDTIGFPVRHPAEAARNEEGRLCPLGAAGLRLQEPKGEKPLSRDEYLRVPHHRLRSTI